MADDEDIVGRTLPPLRGWLYCVDIKPTAYADGLRSFAAPRLWWAEPTLQRGESQALIRMVSSILESGAGMSSWLAAAAALVLPS